VDWEKDVSPLVEAVGVELDGTESEEGGLTEKIKSTTDASSDLTDELTKDDGLIDSVGEELTAV
jgi:hypothetical protein